MFPGYDNRDESGQIINVRNNSGLPDTFVAPSMQKDTFREYEFTVDSLKEFDGFKIKVMMTATNQAHPPKFSEFRAIALS
mgnify:CR=1 FL=1